MKDDKALFEIRELRDGDFDAALRLWNEARPSDPITARVFRRKVILDVNFDPEGYLMAEADGRPVGFVYVIVRRAPLDNDGDMETGVATINGFGMLPDAPSGTGEALLAAGETWAKQHGAAKMIHSSYKPYYFTQGFDVEREQRYIDLFLSCGYSVTGESYAREIDLLSYQISDEVRQARVRAEAQGFAFGPLSDETLLSFWQFMNFFQPASWRIRLRQSLRDSDDYGRVRVVTYRGEVVGFTTFWDPDGSPERFGPFGVRGDFRGMKLGQILLSDCLYEMKARGLHSAWMQSTGKGSAADHVYAKAGFRVIRTHVPMEKIL